MLVEKMDFWLIRGFHGCVKLLKERCKLPIGFSIQILKQAAIEKEDLETCLRYLDSHSISNYPEDKASLAGVDNWISQGFIGLNNHLLDRLDDPTEFDERVLENLKTERDKLNRVIAALESRTQR